MAFADFLLRIYERPVPHLFIRDEIFMRCVFYSTVRTVQCSIYFPASCWREMLRRQQRVHVCMRDKTRNRAARLKFYLPAHAIFTATIHYRHRWNTCHPFCHTHLLTPSTEQGHPDCLIARQSKEKQKQAKQWVMSLLLWVAHEPTNTCSFCFLRISFPTWISEKCFVVVWWRPCLLGVCARYHMAILHAFSDSGLIKRHGQNDANCSCQIIIGWWRKSRFFFHLYTVLLRFAD